MNDIINFLKDRGYKEYPGHNVHGHSCVWAGQMTLSEPCERNDGIYRNVQVYSVKYNGDYHNSITLEIVGNLHNVWFRLEAYSIMMNELDKFPAAEEYLEKAWQAIAKG